MDPPACLGRPVSAVGSPLRANSTEGKNWPFLSSAPVREVPQARGGALLGAQGPKTAALPPPKTQAPSHRVCADAPGPPASPTCFSTFPSRPIMLGSSGSSASAGPLPRSLSAIAGPRPTIWSTLPGRDPVPSVSSGGIGGARGPLLLGQAAAARSRLRAESRADRGAARNQDRWTLGAWSLSCSPPPPGPVPRPFHSSGAGTLPRGKEKGVGAKHPSAPPPPPPSSAPG